MDAPEADHDIKLQKISGDLLTQFDQTLIPFLRKPDEQGGTVPRSRVRCSELERLSFNILGSFQELPQLLDPYLPKWIPFLSQTYLQLLSSRGHDTHQRHDKDKMIVSAEYAICRLLYTFCKIRGEKVIIRFLNVEAKYLELLVTKIENAEELDAKVSVQEDAEARTGPPKLGWVWEQRYIVLLWISHLLLAPFDLSTISSVDKEDMVVPSTFDFEWPENVPGIALRVLPLAIKYLASPSKEQAAAKAVMVRLAMRRDMQHIGLLSNMVHWALKHLNPREEVRPQSSHVYLGLLSFLAGVLRSAAETSDMNDYLAEINDVVESISSGATTVARFIYNFAPARKMILKIMRLVAVTKLKQSQQNEESELLAEYAVANLLDSLSDNDTPVRLAASKSLSIITLTLDPGMASEIVEEVLNNLQTNVLWQDFPYKRDTTGDDAGKKYVHQVRDLSAVDPLAWHGLILTLSHLLYRRSPPATQLPEIIAALLVGLSFEQRNTTNISVGANVRDAACFGIWAIARRYTTAELQDIDTTSIHPEKPYPENATILQILATELVTTACLDPAGNIRRGSSAALQELIGRHPDMVEQGIWVVQKVDYHAVARRSRALKEVALAATTLSGQYGHAVLDGILGWRGIGDPDTPSRRDAAKSFGSITAMLAKASEHPGKIIMRAITDVNDRLLDLQARQVEERHGLLLCFAALLEELFKVRPDHSDAFDLMLSVSRILDTYAGISFRRPELIAEAGSQVIVAMFPFLQILVGKGIVTGESQQDPIYTIQVLLEAPSSGELRQALNEIDNRGGYHSGHDVNSDDPTLGDFVTSLENTVRLWLSRNEAETAAVSSKAALVLLLLSPPHKRNKLIDSWSEAVCTKPLSGLSEYGAAYLHMLAMAQPLAFHMADTSSEATGPQDPITRALLSRWRTDTNIATRVAILQSLANSHMLLDEADNLTGLLTEGLADHTTDARGDIGSHVRVQALRAVRALWADEIPRARRIGAGGLAGLSPLLFRTVLGLAAEKLDRIRPEAQAALALALRSEHRTTFSQLGFSSQAYFTTLLNLIDSDTLRPDFQSLLQDNVQDCTCDLLVAYVTSAHSGHDDLVIAARAALIEFCTASNTHKDRISTALLRNLKTNQGNDRVLVPTLEIVAFLFHVGLVSDQLDLKSLCLQTQKAGYKTGNVRKLEACIKVYGAVASSDRQHPGVQEARKRLGAFLHHPWPKVRNTVIDELWGILGEADEAAASNLLSVDWGKAPKTRIEQLVNDLQLL